MAIRRSSSVRAQSHSRGFTTVLASAFHEWLLILLLFIDALFSYSLTRFARFFKLKTPCVLCSRLDHVVGNEKPGFYLGLICDTHKSEVSSLVFCHVHNNLGDVHGMCEGCLFSFATQNKSNNETYRLLVGKLGSDHDPLLEDQMHDSSNKRKCSCCNEPCISRSNTNILLHTKSIGAFGDELAEADIPLPASVEKCGSNFHDCFNKNRERRSKAVASSEVEDHNTDPLPHVGYMELKITSESESDVQLSDEDDESFLAHESNKLKEVIVQCVSSTSHISKPEILGKTLFDDLASEKMIRQTSTGESPLLVPELQHDVDDSHDLPLFASEATGKHGLEELNWHQVDENGNSSTVSKPSSYHEVPSTSNIGDASVKASEETVDVSRSIEIGAASIIENEATFQSESGLNSITVSEKTDQALTGPVPAVTNLMDLSDAYKLVVGNKGNQVSNMLAERFNSKDSARISEDLKLLLSQISAARGLDSSLNEMSPRVQGNGDDLNGIQILQKRISLERNLSDLSVDGSIVSEIEGESMVDRLKRQVEYDRKCMSVLYKELEEERNASGIAASQALAMITRLQEEKATLQMEALQYLRMMEEQAEYDVDALQKSNDLLAKTERKVQDLESELEIYRKSSPCQSILERAQEPGNDLKGADTRVDQSDVIHIGDEASTIDKPPSSENSEGNSESIMINGNKDASIHKDFLWDFEDERLYISQCLKNLEKKIHLFSNNGVHMPNGGYSGKESNGVNYHEHHHWKEVSPGSSKREEDAFSNSPLSSRNPLTQEDLDSNRDASIIREETDLVALKNEMSVLNERLKALEADRNFLEHTINSLRTGDGVRFVQEIAHQLQELHRIGIRREQGFL